MTQSKFILIISILPRTTLHFLMLILPLSLGFISRFEINEGVPVESHVGSLVSYGHSVSGSLMYNKVSNPKDASRYFNVDKFSGRITVASDLDREKICPLPTFKPDDDCILHFSVTCLRIVGGGVEAIADVLVSLRDVNDNGCKFVPSTEQIIRIRESADVDKTRVRLNSPLDPDSARLGHSIQWNQVRLKDPSGTFRLHIVHPTMGSNSYSIGYQHQDAQLFVGLHRRLDFENTKHYELFITAGDGFHECKLDLHVDVEDADDNFPIFDKTIYNVTIPENLPLDEKIITVKAQDADAGEYGKVFYSIDPYLTDPTTLEVFRVDRETGSIFRRTKLNHQDSLYHQLTVRASNIDKAATTSPTAPYNGGHPSFLAKVCITLEDVNDHEPVINIFSLTGSKKLTLSENLPSGQDVAILSVEDRDKGANAIIECQLKSQSIAGALSLHSMTSKLQSSDESVKIATSRKYKLLATRSFDREQHPEVFFSIECWDGGKPALRSIQKEVISILDVNDCVPAFENETYHFKVYEDPNPSIIGTRTGQIGQIKARDDDIGQNKKLEYNFSAECPQSFLDVVKLDKNTGILHSAGGLDREKIDFISCKVIVRDSGIPVLSSQTNVEIEILDINDNAPQFEQLEYNFQVVENSNAGTLVGIVRVFDADLGESSKLQFSLEGVRSSSWSQEANVEGLFSSFHPSTEKSDSHLLSLLRFEASVTQKHLLDDPYGANLSHGECRGSIYDVRIYTTTPIDREATSSLSGTNSNAYLMNGSNGNVILRFMLRAQDSGSPRLVSRVPINLLVSDVNDNAPVFIFPPMDSANATDIRLSIREPIGFQFTKIVASDPDAAENSSLVYRILAGDPLNLYKLNPRSGELSVAKDCSGNDQHIGQHLLFLEAVDRGSPRRSSKAQLLVRMDNSEPLGRVEHDIFGFPIFSSRRGGSSNSGSNSRSMNLYIIAAIIVASFVISSVLLVVICLVVRRSKTSEQGGGDCSGRYCSAGGGCGGAGGNIPNGSIFRDANIRNGYLKSVPLTLGETKYTTRDPLAENLSEANFSYLTPQPTNGGFVYEEAVGFHATPLCSNGNTVTTTTATFPLTGMSSATGFTDTDAASPPVQLLNTTAAAGPDGMFRLVCLPARQAHTLGRCNLLGQTKLAEDRLLGKRNSLTDRDSGNGDSLDVGSCLLALQPGLEAPRSITPCFQHFHIQHPQQHHFPLPPPAISFAIASEHQYMTSTSPIKAMGVLNTQMTSTFV